MGSMHAPVKGMRFSTCGGGLGVSLAALAGWSGTPVRKTRRASQATAIHWVVVFAVERWVGVGRAAAGVRTARPRARARMATTEIRGKGRDMTEPPYGLPRGFSGDETLFGEGGTTRLA